MDGGLVEGVGGNGGKGGRKGVFGVVGDGKGDDCVGLWIEEEGVVSVVVRVGRGKRKGLEGGGWGGRENGGW